MGQQLKGMKVAILATDMVEESELVEPRKALDEAGALTCLVSPKQDEIISANHFDKSATYKVDVWLEDAHPEEYDALLIPGGALNADHLRVEPRVQEFIQYMDEHTKPVAIICHGPWELISAGVVEGRTLTSYHTIKDDIENAGGEWEDQEVVVDSNWVTSRKPDDIPKFNQALIALFVQARQSSLLT